jgi:hypothetical protein
VKRIVTILGLLVMIASAAAAQETVLFIPAAASAAGANDSFFVTDVRLFNPSPDESVTISLAWLRRNADNTGADEVAVEVGPRQGVALDDVVADTLGTSGAGGIRLRADRPFLATSRTYNAGGEQGTFGQFIPGSSPDDALDSGILLQIQNDSADSGFRSNAGFANPNSFTVTVTVRVFDLESGMLLGERSRDLPPLAVSQINNVFGFVGVGGAVVNNASVEFTATGFVLGYASVLDNTSSDPIYVLPFPDAGTPEPENRPPEGTIDTPEGDEMIQAGETVSFAGSVSDPDGDDVTVEWDFGDGITSTELIPGDHTYTDAGTYTVTFTATDERGLSDPTPDTRTITVTGGQAATFTMVQEQIFNPSCARSGCHGNGSSSAGLNLDPENAYDEIVNVPSLQRESLDRIEPGEPEISYLWLKVTDDPSINGSRMPPSGSGLSQDLLDLLRSWIEAGAPNN